MMWIVVSYDFPSENSAGYRRFRKQLLKCGFSFVQKSLCWRWVHSPEKSESVCRAVRAARQPDGRVLLWQLPDRTFAAGSSWVNDTDSPMPDPPDPWLII